jgi:hypothetical protein
MSQKILLLSIAIPGQIRYNGTDNRVTVCLLQEREQERSSERGKREPMAFLQDFFTQLTRLKWSDYLDIILVGYLLYRLLPMLRSSGAARIA